MTGKSLVRTFLVAAVTILVSVPSIAQKQDLSKELKELLKQSEGVPSIAALLIQNGRIEALGAAGKRKSGKSKRVTIGDKYHLGSCTKAMTATLAAILVERGSIEWTSTIEEFFKDGWLHSGYGAVTLQQLLSNAGGCPKSPPDALWRELYTSNDKIKPVKQREMLAEGILSLAPEYEPGTDYVYSNAGYAIAGLMLERATKKTWEKLMEKELFSPLKMKSAGFGAPASEKVLNQPWGHMKGDPVPPKPFGDNPAAIGPAGTVHCSIEDWARFALFHLEARPGGLLKKKESFEILHRLHNKSGGYGLGWLVSNSPGAGKLLAHDGSNGMWYASIYLFPEKQTGVLVCLNAADETAKEVCANARSLLREKAGIGSGER